jgi:hypothetical protein
MSLQIRRPDEGNSIQLRSRLYNRSTGHKANKNQEGEEKQTRNTSFFNRRHTVPHELFNKIKVN